MPQRKAIRLIFLGTAIIVFYLLSFPLNSWLSATMPRHQLIQLPAMFLLGLLFAFAVFRKFAIADLSWEISGLIVIMTSLVFWMLPHSVDLAAINPSVNRIMQLNMIFAGLLLVAIFRDLIIEVKILFLAMISSMLLAVGITLRVFDVLLCSSFNIAEQKTTGLYLILFSLLLFLFTLVLFFKAPLIKNGTGKVSSSQTQ